MCEPRARVHISVCVCVISKEVYTVASDVSEA